jgi:hypothetical protein
MPQSEKIVPQIAPCEQDLGSFSDARVGPFTIAAIAATQRRACKPIKDLSDKAGMV